MKFGVFWLSQHPFLNAPLTCENPKQRAVQPIQTSRPATNVDWTDFGYFTRVFEMPNLFFLEYCWNAFLIISFKTILPYNRMLVSESILQRTSERNKQNIRWKVETHCVLPKKKNINVVALNGSFRWFIWTTLKNY